MKELSGVIANESCLPFPSESVNHPNFERELSILDYREMVIQSMICFSEEVNAGQFSDYVSVFPRGDKKNAKIMPDAEFRLLPSLVETEPNSVFGTNLGNTVAGKMCQDGDFGFSLAYAKEPQDKLTLLAISSFMTPSKIRNGNYYGMEDILPLDFSDSTPVIVQIQGASYDTYEQEPDGAIFRRDAANMIQQFRWEEVLVRLTAAWAQTVGIHQLGILSASQNYYINNVDTTVARMYRRYDKTAERLGFRLNPGDIHVLDL